MLVLTPSKLNKRTKVIAALVISGLVSISIPALRDAIAPWIENHPHLVPFSSLFFVLLATLQNPLCRDLLLKRVADQEEPTDAQPKVTP